MIVRDTQISLWLGEGLYFLEAIFQICFLGMLENLNVEFAGDVEYAFGVVGELHILMEPLVLVFGRGDVLFFDVEHEAFGLVLIGPVELLAVDERRDPRGADHDVDVVGVDGLAVLLVALRADRLVGELSHVALEHLASDLHLDEDDEEGRHEGVAQLEDVEVEQGVEHVGEVAVVLELGEDLEGAHLEELVDVAEEALEVVVEVLSGVHEHRVEDEPVEEDEHLQEDGHDQREGEAQVLVEVVHLVLLLALGELEDRQDLQEGADGGVLGAEEDDDAHQLQEEVPVAVLALDGCAVLDFAAEEAVALALMPQQDGLVDVDHEQKRSDRLLGQPQSVQLP